MQLPGTYRHHALLHDAEGRHDYPYTDESEEDGSTDSHVTQRNNSCDCLAWEPRGNVGDHHAKRRPHRLKGDVVEPCAAKRDVAICVLSPISMKKKAITVVRYLPLRDLFAAPSAPLSGINAQPAMTTKAAPTIT